MKRSCTIAFNDGESVKFEFEEQVESPVRANLIDDILERNTFACEIAGQLVVFPMVNIRSITIDPAPDKLPRSVIKGANLT